MISASQKTAAILIACAATTIAFERPSSAQAELSLRSGLDVRPLIFAGENGSGGSGGGTIGDVGWVGIHLAPGLRLAKIITLELDIVPLVPISGPAKFDLLVGPSVLLDLYIFYLRAGVPLGFVDGVNAWLEGAAGISFLGYGYLGVAVDYYTRSGFNLFSVGAELGFRYGG
jgi:hypothetical protein